MRQGNFYKAEHKANRRQLGGGGGSGSGVGDACEISLTVNDEFTLVF